jgi:hypothetical protein
MDLRIHCDTRQFEKGIRDLYRDQIPFAAALALTRTAQDAQAAVKANLPKQFIIRRPWTQGGIRIESAKKKDWPLVAASVGSIDPYMVDFEEGGLHVNEGTRNAARKEKSFVIPSQVRKMYGIANSSVITKRRWPGQLVADHSIHKEMPGMVGTRRGVKNGRRRQGKPFLLSIAGKAGVYIANGKPVRLRGKSHEGLHLLWQIKKTPARAPRKQWLYKTAQATVAAKIEKNFEAAMAQATATRR